MFEADVNQLPANKLGQGQADGRTRSLRHRVGSGGSRTGTYNGISNYQSAQFMLHVPTNHGLAAEVSYTWARLYDDMDDSGWGNQFGNVSIKTPITPLRTMGLRISTGQTPSRGGILCVALRERTPIPQVELSRCSGGRLDNIG